MNRTGLAGSAFELDDRLVATVAHAAAIGYTGIKHMTRIDTTDPLTSGALELLGQVLEETRIAGIEALIEAITWRDGEDGPRHRLDRLRRRDRARHGCAGAEGADTRQSSPDAARVEAVARIVSSVGVPVLFLGGPRASRADGSDGVGADPKASAMPYCSRCET